MPKTERKRTVRALKPCGTPAAYTRHIRAAEEPCEPCRQAAYRQGRAAYERKLAARAKVPGSDWYADRLNDGQCATCYEARHLKYCGLTPQEVSDQLGFQQVESLTSHLKNHSNRALAAWSANATQKVKVSA